MAYREDFVPKVLWHGEKYPGDVIVEQLLFRKRIATAFIDEDARAFLSTQFKINANHLKVFAEQFEQKLLSTAKIKNVTTSLEALSGKRTKAEYVLVCQRAEKMHSELTANEEEFRLASSAFLRTLSRLTLKSELDKRKNMEDEKDAFDRTVTEYDPAAGHTLNMIDQHATARLGKLMVKTEPRIRPMVKTLSVHIDTDFIESGSSNVLSSFVRIRVIIESLIKFAKLKKVSVTVTSGSNDYFLITPDAHPSVEILLFRLVYQRSDRMTDDDHWVNYGFRTKDGLPKNLLYLSASQGKANAVKYALGKSVNVTAKSFSELGLDIFPRLKLHGPDADKPST